MFRSAYGSMLPVVRAVVTPRGKIQRRTSLKHLSPNQPRLQPARFDIKKMLMHTHQIRDKPCLHADREPSLRRGSARWRWGQPKQSSRDRAQGLIQCRRRPSAIDDLHMGQGDDRIGNRNIRCQRRLCRLARTQRAEKLSGKRSRGTQKKFASTEGLLEGFEGMSHARRRTNLLSREFRLRCGGLLEKFANVFESLGHAIRRQTLHEHPPISLPLQPRIQQRPTRHDRAASG